jgi:acetyltransferase-like isoleucine patch superfamily enzyme
VVIGSDCRIGPHAVLEGAVRVAAGSHVAPFSHLTAN